MDLKQFGEQLRSLRQQAQWSQEGLIEALDQLARAGPHEEYRVIDSTLLSRWERAHTQKGRQWKPTRAYTLHLIHLFAPHLDLASAQQWAAQAGYAIQPAEIQVWFPPPEATPLTADVEERVTPPHNLPAPLTSFIGREAEIARVLEYLATPPTRLITLVGEGGVGKTRLALQVAQTILNFRFWILDSGQIAPSDNSKSKIAPTGRLPKFQDGIYFVSLVGVSTASAAVSTLANEVGIVLGGAEEPEQQVLAFLRKRQLLLVLDNFEHLVATVSPLVVAILQMAPDVQLIVTSRERLNLAGEWVVALTGLPFPDAATLSPASTTAETHEAVQLFVERARQSDAGFDPHADSRQTEAMERICRLLQGVPLGIELAAAWVHLLSPTAIGDEIARNLDFLTAPQRNAPARHRSMRAVFEHSWRLLTGQEQTGLAALAVFQGSFTYEAATQVAEASLLMLRNLVDKSLLQYRAGRYDLHELLRQFADEQLKLDAHQHTIVSDRHSAYYLEFVAKQEQRLAGHEAQQAAAEIEAEMNNIRRAWRWATTHLQFTEIERSLYALWRFYLLNGSSSEGEQFVGLVIDQIKAAEPILLPMPLVQLLLSKLLTMRTLFLTRMGRRQPALRSAEEAVAAAELCRTVNPATFAAVKAFAHWAWGFVLNETGAFEEARTVLADGLHLLADRRGAGSDRELRDDMEWQLRVLLGSNYIQTNKYTLARDSISQALHLCQNAGKVRGQLTCLGNLGWLELLAGDYRAARLAYEEALPLSRTFGYCLEEAANLVELGDTVRRQGEYGLARDLLERGWSLAHNLNAYQYENYAVEALGYLYTYLGDYAGALAWLDRGHPENSGIEGGPILARAVLHLQRGDPEGALSAANDAWQLLNPNGTIAPRAKTLVVLGHAQVGLGLWAVAAESYRQALAAYTAMNKPAMAVEAQAGLAAVALQQDDLTGALQGVEEILPVLAEAPYMGIDEPFYTYWVCYRVLATVQDRRAVEVLHNAYLRLETYASQIGDATLRQSFWEKGRVHRELRDAYRQRLQSGD